MTEQRQDVVRQQQMKQLASEADARWEAKPRVMEAPRAPTASLEGGPTTEPEQSPTTEPAQTTAAPAPSPAPDADQSKEKNPDPWAQAKARGPSEKWQPEAWTPSAGKK